MVPSSVLGWYTCNHPPTPSSGEQDRVMVRGDLTPLLGLAVAILCPSHCTWVSCSMGALREWSKPPHLAEWNHRSGVSYSSAPLTLWPKWATAETKRQRRTEGGSENKAGYPQEGGRGKGVPALSYLEFLLGGHSVLKPDMMWCSPSTRRPFTFTLETSWD